MCIIHSNAIGIVLAISLIDSRISIVLIDHSVQFAQCLPRAFTSRSFLTEISADLKKLHSSFLLPGGGQILKEEKDISKKPLPEEPNRRWCPCEFSTHFPWWRKERD